MSCPLNHSKMPLCNPDIDYSTVLGTRVLPFQISLNLNNSILDPAVGENQRFCYDITAVGEDIPMDADLSHLVLGICEEIPAEEIDNITVVINDIPQEVEFGEGGNVELCTDENPDPSTGCPGLKFNFPLDKISGIMNICFELTVVHEVAGIDVCLFGGNTTAKGLKICGPYCKKQTGSCPVVGYQRSTVCVPVTVTPFAHAGTPVTSCCGEPVVMSGEVCPQTGGVCHFTISQEICVAVPVEFGAQAVAGSPSVQCGEASSTNICADCTPSDATVKYKKGGYPNTSI